MGFVVKSFCLGDFMEIKDIKNVENKLKTEIDEMGASPERDKLAEERCVPIIKQEIELVMLKSIQNLYFLIKEYVSSNKAFLFTGSGLKDLNTIDDYRHNLAVIRKCVNAYNGDINDLFGGEIGNKHSITVKTVNAGKYFSQFLQQVIAFVDSAAYITNHCSKKTDSAYIRTVSKTLPTMRSNLSGATDGFAVWCRNQEYRQIFDSVVEFFISSADVAQSFAVEYLKTQKDKKKAEEEKLKIAINPANVSKPAQAPELSARLKLIKEANDKYEEFCLDFMRDLEKQYAHSSKDLYEQFVNVRFKKFIERYPMPIPNSASEGYAKEVINQINILIDHISRISENSYVTSVYKVKE